MTVMRHVSKDREGNCQEVEEWSELIDTLHSLSQDHSALRQQLEEWSGSEGVAPVKLTKQDDPEVIAIQSVIRTNMDIVQSPCAGSQCECSEDTTEPAHFHGSNPGSTLRNVDSVIDQGLLKTDPVKENSQANPAAQMLSGHTPVDPDTTVVHELSGLSSLSLQSLTVTSQTVKSSAKT